MPGGYPFDYMFLGATNARYAKGLCDEMPGPLPVDAKTDSAPEPACGSFIASQISALTILKHIEYVLNAICLSLFASLDLSLAEACSAERNVFADFLSLSECFWFISLLYSSVSHLRSRSVVNRQIYDWLYFKLVSSDVFLAVSPGIWLFL